MKQCRPLAQALVEAKAEIDHETRKDKVKREEKKQTKKRNNKRMSRCEDSPEQNECTKMSGQRAQRIAKRCDRYVEKNGSDKVG